MNIQYWNKVKDQYPYHVLKASDLKESGAHYVYMALRWNYDRWMEAGNYLRWHGANVCAQRDRKRFWVNMLYCADVLFNMGHEDMIGRVYDFRRNQ